jgi:hypothetical protein
MARLLMPAQNPLWLGHVTAESTEAYLRADPAEKLAVLIAHAPPAIEAGKLCNVWESCPTPANTCPPPGARSATPFATT